MFGDEFSRGGHASGKAGAHRLENTPAGEVPGISGGLPDSTLSAQPAIVPLQPRGIVPDAGAPSIIPSPGSPGIPPNNFGTIIANGDYTIPAGTTYFGA